MLGKELKAQFLHLSSGGVFDMCGILSRRVVVVTAQGSRAPWGSLGQF